MRQKKMLQPSRQESLNHTDAVTKKESRAIYINEAKNDWKKWEKQKYIAVEKMTRREKVSVRQICMEWEGSEIRRGSWMEEKTEEDGDKLFFLTHSDILLSHASPCILLTHARGEISSIQLLMGPCVPTHAGRLLCQIQVQIKSW